MTNDEPALVKMGANTRGAPDGYNLDVRGTPGPDHLGQETVDVDGHPSDRPGVRSRLPENDPTDMEIARMDTGEELPVLLRSDMRADPIEGTQGSFTEIIEGECARCGYDRLKVSVHTLAGEHHEVCNACGAIQDHRADGGYRMPPTDENRVKEEANAGQELGVLHTRAIYDMEETTGIGPYVSLVGHRDYTRLRKDDVAELFWTLVENGDISLSDQLHARYRANERAIVAMGILPDGLKVEPGQYDDEDDE